MTIAARGFALGALFVVGCAQAARPIIARQPYAGPTDPLDVVLAKVNANNGRIATLNGDGRFEATLVQGGDRRFVNGSIAVIHTKPDQLRMIATKPLVSDRLFDLGANGEIYWFHAPVADALWHGRVENASRVAAAGLPISPTLIADVLGVATLDVDLLAQPVPTMRFNPDYDAYMLTWSKPTGDRWVTLREVWYDRRTFEPRRIWLFDRNGRVALRAMLGEFAPLDGDDANAPRTARTFDLLFPESGSRLTIRLDDVRASRGGSPNRITYRFSPERATASKKTDLDATP